MVNGYEKRQKFIMEDGCPALAHEEALVTVPVKVCAFVDVGDTKLECMGPPVITKNCDDTPGKPCAVSKFTVSQRLCVDIPMIFGMDTEVGEGHVCFEHEHEHEHEHPEPCKCKYAN